MHYREAPHGGGCGWSRGGCSAKEFAVDVKVGVGTRERANKTRPSPHSLPCLLPIAQWWPAGKAGGPARRAPPGLVREPNVLARIAE
jgi:hypothetical protein